VTGAEEAFGHGRRLTIPLPRIWRAPPFPPCTGRVSLLGYDEDLGPRLQFELRSLPLPHAAQNAKSLAFDVLRPKLRDGRFVGDGDLRAAAGARHEAVIASPARHDQLGITATVSRSCCFNHGPSRRAVRSHRTRRTARAWLGHRGLNAQRGRQLRQDPRKLELDFFKRLRPNSPRFGSVEVLRGDARRRFAGRTPPEKCVLQELRPVGYTHPGGALTLR
jgi:hypothetical protein